MGFIAASWFFLTVFLFIHYLVCELDIFNFILEVMGWGAGAVERVKWSLNVTMLEQWHTLKTIYTLYVAIWYLAAPAQSLQHAKSKHLITKQI